MAAWPNRCYFIRLRGKKRGTGVCLYRTSWDLLNVIRWKAEGEEGNLKRAREVQEVLQRRNRGHMRGTTRGQKMYSRGTEDEQQRYNRSTTGAYTKLRITKIKFSTPARWHNVLSYIPMFRRHFCGLRGPPSLYVLSMNGMLKSYIHHNFEKQIRA